MAEKSTHESRWLSFDHKRRELTEIFLQKKFKQQAEDQQKAEYVRLLIKTGLSQDEARERVRKMYAGELKPQKITIFVKAYLTIHWWMHLLRKWRYEMLVGCKLPHTQIPDKWQKSK